MGYNPDEWEWVRPFAIRLTMDGGSQDWEFPADCNDVARARQLCRGGTHIVGMGTQYANGTQWAATDCRAQRHTNIRQGGEDLLPDFTTTWVNESESNQMLAPIWSPHREENAIKGTTTSVAGSTKDMDLTILIGRRKQADIPESDI